MQTFGALLGLCDGPALKRPVRAIAATFVFAVVGLLVLGVVIEPLIVRAMILGALLATASWIRTKRTETHTREPDHPAGLAE